MKEAFFFLLFLPFLFSCADQKDALAKVWIYEEPTEKNPLMYEGFSADPKMSHANFIDLQADGTYSSYLNGYENGKWLLKEGKLILVNKRKELSDLTLVKTGKEELVCTDKTKRQVYRFSGYTNEFALPAQNPFAAVNNQWRLKAKHKESDAELNARMKNHFSFWEKYFAWGSKEHVGYLDVRSTPGILKIYGNGFQLEYYDNLLPEWRNIFYDTADCRIAHENLHYKMYEKNIKWPDTDNRFERFISAFHQLQGWMDEKMSPYVRR